MSHAHSSVARSPSKAEVLQNYTEVSLTDGEQIKEKEVTYESSETKTTNAQSFQTCWLRNHTWLHFENGTRFCFDFCRKSQKTNPFASEG